MPVGCDILLLKDTFMQTNFELKKHNTVKIFSALKAHAALSRKELATLTGLSWGSVSAITAELLQRGLAIAEKEASAGGRPADRLALNGSRFLQLGVDVNSVGLTFVVVNLRGETVHAEFVPLISREKDALLSLLFQKTDDVIRKFPGVTGINISMQGKINRKTGISLRTNFFHDWKNVPLVELFKKRFALPTALYHDPDCLLAYHLRTDPRLTGKKDGFVVRIDDGIGMARLIDGKLYETGDDASFELGHVISVPGGNPCPCGKRGCLETYASIRGMKESFERAAINKTEIGFLTLLKNNDARIAAVVHTATAHLGVALANLFTLAAPEFILLDGAMFSYAPHCFAEIAQKTESSLCDECCLLLASYKKEAPAIGACLLTIEKITEEILFDA